MPTLAQLCVKAFTRFSHDIDRLNSLPEAEKIHHSGYRRAQTNTWYFDVRCCSWIKPESWVVFLCHTSGFYAACSTTLADRHPAFNQAQAAAWLILKVFTDEDFGGWMVARPCPPIPAALPKTLKTNDPALAQKVRMMWEEVGLTRDMVKVEVLKLPVAATATTTTTTTTAGTGQGAATGAATAGLGRGAILLGRITKKKNQVTDLFFRRKLERDRRTMQLADELFKYFKFIKAYDDPRMIQFPEE